MSTTSLGIAAAALTLVCGCSTEPEAPRERGDRTRMTPEQAAVRSRLETFDDLDFNVFSHQQWSQMRRSHATDVVVHWPDGRTTRGLDPHIEDLKQMFVYAPDTRIQSHPIKFGSGEYTCVTGVMEGTFTKPMKLPDGRTIEPTGKSFKLDMCTIGRWNNGVMKEEWLFWDNQSFMKQIGVGEAPRNEESGMRNNE